MFCWVCFRFQPPLDVVNNVYYRIQQCDVLSLYICMKRKTKLLQIYTHTYPCFNQLCIYTCNKNNSREAKFPLYTLPHWSKAWHPQAKNPVWKQSSMCSRAYASDLHSEDCLDHFECPARAKILFSLFPVELCENIDYHTYYMYVIISCVIERKTILMFL